VPILLAICPWRASPLCLDVSALLAARGGGGDARSLEAVCMIGKRVLISQNKWGHHSYSKQQFQRIIVRFPPVCRIDAARMLKRMIYRFAFITAVTLLCVSCTSTDFQSWEGRNSVVEGHGGTRKVVDGMDVWTHGDPPRRFQVLGIIEDETTGV